MLFGVLGLTVSFVNNRSLSHSIYQRKLKSGDALFFVNFKVHAAITKNYKNVIQPTLWMFHTLSSKKGLRG